MNYTKLIFSFRKRRQNLLIFRNFTILLVALVLLPAGVSAQKGNVSVNINNGTVKTFIKEIEKQTRYTFVYRNNVLNDQAKVTVNCKNKPLDQVLSQVFTPLNVSYSLNNNTIVLVKKEVQKQKKSEKKTIKGTVTDGRGEPIIGANVIQEGGIGTITDVDGNFTVTADPSKPLDISYIGYKKKNNFRMISDPSLPYNKWTFLCDASTQDFAIYYSPRSEAASGTLSIYEVYKKNCRLEQAKEGAGIYYRAVAPDVIEYAVISNDDFDSEKMVDNVTRVELTY